MPDLTFIPQNPANNSAYNLLRSKLVGRVHPLDITIEVTQKCNLKCTHCYNFDREQRSPPNVASELSSEKILDVIDQVVAAGCWNITFTGGEVLVHPDLYRFIERARDHSCRVAIKTNGVLLNDKRARRLAELGVHNVWISFYGTDAKTHDDLTAVPSSFEKSMAAIESVLKHGMTLSIASVLTNDNVDQVAGLHAMAKKYNAGFVITPEVTARYDGTDSSRKHLPVIDNMRRAFTDNPEVFGAVPDFNPDRFMQCSCAETGCAIASNGDVYPCINAPLKAGSILESSFQDIWTNSPLFQKIRSLKPQDFKDCQGCDDKPWCSRSSGTVFTNTGDYLGADPVTCTQAGIRREVWEAKNGSVDVQEKSREFLMNNSSAS
ncbi:MAG: radical SAM protein [Deltaproteobacteria bacterium]|nr:radical SAM protein [Deltaproteobacteria bacterium]